MLIVEVHSTFVQLWYKR